MHGTQKKASRKNELSFNAAPYLKVILKTDICQVPGISDETALTMYAETGGNLSGFKSAASFTSWIGVAPNNKISGGKIISSHLPKKNHPLKTALIHAANSLYRSDNPLGLSKAQGQNRSKGRKMRHGKKTCRHSLSNDRKSKRV